MKILLIHLPGHSYLVSIEQENFDTEVANLERILEHTGSCWIPITNEELSAVGKVEQHIFLTEWMKKQAYLESIVTE